MIAFRAAIIVVFAGRGRCSRRKGPWPKALEWWASLKGKAKSLSAVVRHIPITGAFVDLGVGVDGCCMSPHSRWRRITPIRPTALFHIGQNGEGFQYIPRSRPEESRSAYFRSAEAARGPIRGEGTSSSK